MTAGQVITICSLISALLGLIATLWKILRWVGKISEGQKCLLRERMLTTYYKNREAGTIRQYEYESFCLQYSAYKALGGNSFIDKIKDEVKEFEVVS